MGGNYRQHAGHVYERDGWTCKLCGLPVAKNRKAPHPLAPSLDHIRPQALDGSDDPDNLQTAHMRWNESKHTRPERGSTVRVVIAPPPELLEILRRLPPLPEPEEPRAPLPVMTCDSIGDVFDAAVGLARSAQVRRLPDVEKLRRWAATKGFVHRKEAQDAIFDQLWGCLDDDSIRDSLCRQVMEEQPAAWFIAKFLMAGEGPEWLDDEHGWEEVADGLMDYVGFDEVDRIVACVVAELEVPRSSAAHRR